MMLYSLLGFEDCQFAAGLGWHDRIVQGLPRRSLQVLASYLKVDPAPLEELVGAGVHSDPLSPASSERLFRIAVAVHRLYAVLKDMDVTVHWLCRARKELQGAIPIVLLTQVHGAQRVYEVIARVRPARKPEPVSAPTVDESLDSDDLADD